ncbi:MAG: aspartate aminotransferase [delta proteobacterium MLS_D]|jgi:aspartate aminotransferase|nr:MAG: aspartate aminotransferase [delta proteobacterium MLS_D]
MTVADKMTTFMTQSSWIRRMFEEGLELKARFGEENVFDFSLGNPNLPPPAEFHAVMKEMVDSEQQGVHGYMPNAGFEEARRAVASYLEESQGVHMSWKQVVMSCGAAGGLNCVFKTLLDPGDEVVIPTPFFAEYRFYVDNMGGITRFVPTLSDFSLDLDAIEDAVSERTRVVLVNSPNNPTGKIYDASSIAGLAALLERKSGELNRDIYLVADEPYRDIVYDGREVPSILAACRNSITATSYSKSLSIPGERIGFLAVNPEASDAGLILDGIALATRILGFVNAPALMQRVVARLQGTKVALDEYCRKRNLLCDGLQNIGYDIVRPEGAFYLFLKSPLEDDVAFVRALQRKNILVVPGSGFAGPGFVRIAYCVDDSTIRNAMEGFREVFHELE